MIHTCFFSVSDMNKGGNLGSDWRGATAALHLPGFRDLECPTILWAGNMWFRAVSFFMLT